MPAEQNIEALRAFSGQMMAMIKASVQSEDLDTMDRDTLRQLLLNTIKTCELRIQAERRDAARENAEHAAMAFQAMHKQEVARLEELFDNRLAELAAQLEVLKAEIRGPEPKPPLKVLKGGLEEG